MPAFDQYLFSGNEAISIMRACGTQKPDVVNVGTPKAVWPSSEQSE